MQAILNFCEQTGFYQFFVGENWKCAVMILIACVLLFLGIVKKFEPLLLVPIAIGMLVTNLPGAGMYHEILFAGEGFVVKVCMGVGENHILQIYLCKFKHFHRMPNTCVIYFSC